MKFLIIFQIVILFSTQLKGMNFYNKKPVIITSIGKIENDILTKVKNEIEINLNLKVKIVPDKITDLKFAFNPERFQYFAPLILKKLHNEFKSENYFRVVGITDVDIYDEGMNFIFGEALYDCCIVSIFRFKPCIKTENIDDKTIERVVKTTIHELGHTFGFMHCNNPECVMYFSNWIGDTDRKGKRFCEFHEKEYSDYWKTRNR